MTKKKLKPITFPETVAILGSPWRIEIRNPVKDTELIKSHADGYTSHPEKLIVVADLTLDPAYANDNQEFIDEIMKRCLRHELVHAFLSESGLGHESYRFNGPWSKNEEMIDWIAIQGSKIAEAWKYCGVFDDR